MTVRLVVSGKLLVDPLITHRMSLSDVEKGIKLIKSGGDVMKVVAFT
jgi:Zn-dependent alcohol dehydrogenase